MNIKSFGKFDAMSLVILSAAPADGVGAIPGAFVGAHVGTIAGGLVCIGGMVGNKFN